jgi:signal transduction histidine kinase/ActR/RegA family two-component response regulator
MVAGSRNVAARLPLWRRPHLPHRWWRDRSVAAKGMTTLAVPLVALLAIASASLLLQNQERRERAGSMAASGLTYAANAVLVDLLNAETGIRGFAATRNPAFLQPYHLALATIGAERKSLRRAAIAVGQAREWRSVDAAVRTELAILAQLPSAVSAASGAGLVKGLENGKAHMDMLRRDLAALDARARLSLAAEQQAVGSLQSTISILDVVALVVGILAGLAGAAIFGAGISGRLAVVIRNAELLGAGQPMEPAGPSRDDIGRLAEALNRAQQVLASRAAELTGARDEALRAGQAKTAFLSRTSHELRTPLNSILGFTQLLEMSDLSDEDRDSARRILAAGRHLLALINELIDIGHIESGDLSLSVEPVPVLPVISEANQLIGPLAAERSISVVQQCAYPALTAYADRQRFRQTLVNLLSNAVKYNDPGGTITIICRAEDDGRASVTIADTGPGLSQDDLERIFIPFERLGAEKTMIEGTGIGLPLAKAVTEAMGGRLTASSVPGAGSAFTISLARAADVTEALPCDAAASTPASLSAVAPGSTIDILYIEDNPTNIEVIARFLKGRPYARLRSAGTGRAGIDLATRDVPDVILLDLHLPDINGDQVLRELKAEPATATVPVLILSADANPGVRRRLIADGAQAYLTKPIDFAEFAGLLDSCAVRTDGQQPHPAQ